MRSSSKRILWSEVIFFSSILFLAFGVIVQPFSEMGWSDCDCRSFPIRSQSWGECGAYFPKFSDHDHEWSWLIISLSDHKMIVNHFFTKNVTFWTKSGLFGKWSPIMMVIANHRILKKWSWVIVAHNLAEWSLVIMAGSQTMWFDPSLTIGRSNDRLFFHFQPTVLADIKFSIKDKKMLHACW